jgi:hypothetical protein
MSKLLADLLGLERREFESAIARLEHMTLGPSIDVRVAVELQAKVREKTQQLGLDPHDTSHEELYYTLLARVERDDVLLREVFGLADADSVSNRCEKIASTLQPLLNKETVLALQPAAIKKILKSVPPKKTLRVLKFRSLDAVLKRVDPYVLYGLAKKLEDKTWHKQLHARLKRLQPRDVGEHSVRLVTMPEAWVEKLDDKLFQHFVQAIPEAGAVLLLPTIRAQESGAVLLATGVLLQAAQRLVIESLPYKLRALQHGIEVQIADIANGLAHTLAPVHGMHFSWHAVYYSLAQGAGQVAQESSFIVSDLEWESTEARLAMLHPELAFWKDTHFAGVYDEARDCVVSLHVLDCASNLVMRKVYGEQAAVHLQGSLWNELQSRYVSLESVETIVHEQLLL